MKLFSIKTVFFSLAATLLFTAAGCKSEDPPLPEEIEGSSKKGTISSISTGSSSALSVSSSGRWTLSGDTFTHDPTLIYVDGMYYNIFTAPYMGYKCSSDGVKWSGQRSIFSSSNYPDWWDGNVPSDFNIWAPEVLKIDDTYYIFYCVSSFGTNYSTIGLLKSSNFKTWTDEGSVLSSVYGDEYNCIDPGIVETADGNLYMCFGSFWNGIYIVEIDRQTMKLKSGSRPKNIASRGYSGGAIEAPFIWNPGNGYYYLLVSYDSCCNGVNSTYSIHYGRSSNPEGPYYDKNGSKMTDGASEALLSTEGIRIGPGGQSVSKDKDGKDILVYHYYDKNLGGRATLAINDIQLDSDGWVVLKAHNR